MKLSPEQYRRGILYWNIPGDVHLLTATTADVTAPPAWSEPLEEPSGSLVQSAPQPYVALTPRYGTGAIKPPFRVRWERLLGGAVQLLAWDNDLKKPPATRKHVPNYGHFHRLVVSIPYLDLEEETVIRVGDAIIRVVDGIVEGERVSPFDTVEVEKGKVSIQGGSVETIEAEGRFIEIVAPGKDRAAAEFAAGAVLGLLALALGDQAAGDVLFSESYTVNEDGQDGFVRIPVRVPTPRVAEAEELEAVEDALPRILGEGRSNRSLLLALRWYERGVRADTYLDKLLSYFIAIETIVQSNAAIHGPIPAEIDRETRLKPLLDGLSATFDRAERNRLSQRLMQASLAERFRYYAEQRGWDEGAVQDFRRLADVRNDAVHGSAIAVGANDVRDARGLLIRLLKSEIEMTGMLPWESVPTVHSAELHFQLKLD